MDFGYFRSRNIRRGFPFKGSLKGVYRGSIAGCYMNIGALAIRMGFWGPLYYSDIKEAPNSIGIFVGPYIAGFGCSTPNKPHWDLNLDLNL